MADTETDSGQESAPENSAPETVGVTRAPANTDIRAGDDAERSDAEERRITTVAEMRQWLRN